MSETTNRPEQLRFLRENTNKITTYRFPSKPLPHSFQLIFHNYDYSKYAASTSVSQDADGSSVFSPNANLGLIPERNRIQESSTGSIELPFPRTLRDNTGTQITAFERDFVVERLTSALAGATGGGTTLGDSAANIGKMAKDVAATFAAGGKNLAQQGAGAALTQIITDTLAVDSSKAMAVGTYLARKYLSGDLAKTAGAITGRVVNPQQTLAFEGVNLREFSFEWDLFPANAQDTEEITNIVNFLKAQMLPETEGVAGVNGLARAFLKYPSVVEPSLLGVQEKHFMRFKRCMIDNVTVDYTGGGSKVAVIKGGVPASVTLGISFKELTIQTRDDYAGLLPNTNSGSATNEVDASDTGG